MRRDVTASGARTRMGVEGVEKLGLDVPGLGQLANVPYAALAETDLPVRDLAKRCGFSGSRALIRAFRRWTESTPTACREDTRDPKSRSPESFGS